MQLLAAVVWRALQWTALEHFSLWRNESDHVLEGHIVGVSGTNPFRLQYEITCDGNWRTRRADISTIQGKLRKSFTLTVDEKNRWWRNHRELSKVRGLEDVDINMTPSTNMLPIRRLDLGIHKSNEVTAAWVRFPSMDIHPLRQVYTNLGDGKYRYETGSFKTEIEVDPLDLTETYPPFWNREAAQFSTHGKVHASKTT